MLRGSQSKEETSSPIIKTNLFTRCSRYKTHMCKWRTDRKTDREGRLKVEGRGGKREKRAEQRQEEQQENLSKHGRQTVRETACVANQNQIDLNLNGSTSKVRGMWKAARKGEKERGRVRKIEG